MRYHVRVIFRYVLMIIAAVLTAVGFAASPALAQQTTLEILGSKLAQHAYETDVEIQLIGRAMGQFEFIRMRCQIFDEQNMSLGVFIKDYSSGDPTRALVVVPDYYNRLVMPIVPRMDNADHASCRFATKNDRLPIVRPDEVQVQMISTHTVQITNGSSVALSSKTMACSGRDKTGHELTKTDEVTSPLGLSDTPGRTVRIEIPWLWERPACAITAVKVKEPPDMACTGFC